MLGPFLRWRHARMALQIPVFALSLLMVGHGLFGPDLAPRNLATTLTWVHFRGALVLALLAAGNVFCMACPFMLPREVARRLFKPRLNWPRRLRNKWLSIGLFIAVLFTYELFDLWASPWWTACLILAFFFGALAVDGVFKHASFCKFVCPIGQFNFVASTISPFEVQIRDAQVCDHCATKDCIRGTREPSNGQTLIQRGCELALFQPLKAGNMDCTFCLDCVHACPHDNVGILSRVPAAELTEDPRRSGIGLFSRRKDLAVLAIVFSFGALLNAFGMVSPVYAVQAFLARILGVQHEVPLLGVIFTILLVVEPILLLGLAAWLTRYWGGSARPILPLAVRYAYALAPLGFGVWLSHYGFHFFSGLFTFIPVFQSAAGLGDPSWGLSGLPANITYAIGFGFLGLGLMGSLMVVHRLAAGESTGRPMRAFVPWAAVCILLSASAIWLMSQPMEMRGTFLAP